MLTRKTYTPALEAEAAPILPGATAAIRRQAVLELARLRRKLTGRSREMAYFTRASVTRPMGRPLGEPATTFAAMLFARLSGHSRKRAEELLRANPNTAVGGVWSVAAQAASEGVKTAEQFEAWLKKTDEEASNQ
jgi:hypothetical protein